MAARTPARWLRLGALAVIYGTLLLAGRLLGDWAGMVIEMDLEPLTGSMIDRMVVLAVALYVVLLALPFVPGIEIGIGLMMMLGPEIALVVYAATVAALCLSYGVGRLLPARAIAALFGALGLTRAEALVHRLEPLDGKARLALLTAQAPRRFVPHLLRYRYPALVVAVNLPGNSLIGGGGGIALAAGLSGLFRAPLFLITVGLAVAPVPLTIYLMGQ